MVADPSPSTLSVGIGRPATARRGLSGRILQESSGIQRRSQANDIDDEALDEIRRYETVSEQR